MRDVTESHVPATPIVGVVAREEVEFRADGHVVNVPLPARDDFQLGAIRPTTHNPTAAIRQLFPVRTGRLDEAVVSDRDIDPPVDADLNPVRRVIGSAKLEIEADFFDERFGAVAHAVAVVVMQGHEIRRGKDDECRLQSSPVTP